MSDLCQECLEIPCECWRYVELGSIADVRMRRYIIDMIEGTGYRATYEKVIAAAARRGFQPIDFRQPEEGELYLSRRYDTLDGWPIVNGDAGVCMALRSDIRLAGVTWEPTRDEVVIVEFTEGSIL